MLLKPFPTEPYREYVHVIFQKLRLIPLIEEGKTKDESKHSENWHPLQRNEQEICPPLFLKITDVWRDVTLAVIIGLKS